jgi:hypothetical protein
MHIERLELAAILVINAIRSVETRKHGRGGLRRYQGRRGTTNQFVGRQAEEVGHTDELPYIGGSLVLFKSGYRLPRRSKQFSNRPLRKSELTPSAPKVASNRHSYRGPV